METLALWFLIFITYSFGGWLMEVIISILERRKLVNRGFLVGPICPIYGAGAVILALVLNQNDSILEIFCVSFLGAAVLEYITSYTMEKLFRVRWWDYSQKPMNLNGRICLEGLVGFSIIGILSIKIFTPALQSLYMSLPTVVLYACSITILVALIADIALSLWLILGVRVTVGTVQKDATAEISERVHEILTDKGKLNRRLVKAFPNQKPSDKPPRQSRQKLSPKQSE